MLDIYILYEYNIHGMNMTAVIQIMLGKVMFIKIQFGGIIMSEKMTKCKSCGNDIASSAKACPNCGAKNSKPIFKKWWFWVIIVVLLIAIIGAAGGDDTGSSSASGNDVVQSTEAAIKVSADDLIRAYVNNSVSADAQYKDKLVTVSGTIYSINEGYVIIEPDLDDLWLNNVYAYYNSGEVEKLAAYAKGDKITMTGECKGENIMSYVEIKYCTIN